MIPSPVVLINDQNQTDGYNAPSGSLVTIMLASSAGVSNWSLTCIGTDDLLSVDTINAGLTINHSTNTATFTAPIADGYDGYALLFESIINNGVDINEIEQNNYSTTFTVYILNNQGLRLSAQNETLEGNQLFGWTVKYNQLIRDANPGNPGIQGATGATGATGGTGPIGPYGTFNTNFCTATIAPQTYSNPSGLDPQQSLVFSSFYTNNSSFFTNPGGLSSGTISINNISGIFGIFWSQQVSNTNNGQLEYTYNGTGGLPVPNQNIGLCFVSIFDVGGIVEIILQAQVVYNIDTVTTLPYSFITIYQIH
jgi:hypothetical protein